MSTTIQETVNTSLNARGYGSYRSMAAPVIDDLEARERELSERLLDYASDLGADRAEVRQQLQELGMAVSADTSDDEDDDDEEWTDERIGKALSEITRQLGALTDFARRNGYSGS